MKYVFNPFTGNLDVFNDLYQGVLASEPSNPKDGWMYINSVNNTLYVYYGYNWQVLHVLDQGTLSYFLLESDDTLLLESGGKLALEV